MLPLFLLLAYLIAAKSLEIPEIVLALGVALAGSYLSKEIAEGSEGKKEQSGRTLSQFRSLPRRWLHDCLTLSRALARRPPPSGGVRADSWEGAEPVVRTGLDSFLPNSYVIGRKEDHALIHELVAGERT